MKIGVIGAGQLGRMLALAGTPLDIEFTFLGQSDAPTLGPLVPGDLRDPDALRAFTGCADILTYETEHFAAETLTASPTPVFPPVEAVVTVQDRLRQKEWLSALDLPLASFAAVDTQADLSEAAEQMGFPLVVKTRREGYDGRGQFVVRHADDIDAAWKALAHGGPLVAEQFIAFEREVSLVSVRGQDGDIRFYPLVENRHENGILAQTLAPAPELPPALTRDARSMVTRILEAFDYVGVLTVEFFVDRDERLLINELAPRVHNSGHWTIEGAETSQFENHVRAIAGLPLGSTAVHGPSILYNLVGKLPTTATILAIEGAHLHRYGKRERPGRKLGHITLAAPDPATLHERSALVEEALLA